MTSVSTIKSHRLDVPQQNDSNQEEVLDEQQLLNQERNCIVVQVGADCSQVKKEQEDVSISQEGEQFGLKQETQTFEAISDHCKRNNHIMDWDNTKIIGSESNRHKRWIKEAIEIRKRGKDTMNRDEGAFMLSHTWDHILQRPSDGGRRGRLEPKDEDNMAGPRIPARPPAEKGQQPHA
ncbi:uncharacterized protein KZ484_017809 [Pholidichthys leucotaenia]